MRILEKIALVLFSAIILILSIVSCLLIFRWIDISTINMIVTRGINGEVSSNIILAISVCFILLAIKCIFFDSTSKEVGDKNGILLENSNGKLSISKETLENLVSSVCREFNSIENVSTRVILDKENNLKVYVNLYLHPDAVIKDLAANLQLRIKEAFKKSSDLEVKEVNVRIRNITPTTKNVVE